MTTPIETDERGGLPSASVAEREYHCPGSRSACKLAPKQKAAAITIEGQEIHSALEKEDPAGLDDEGARIFDEIRGQAFQSHQAWLDSFDSSGKTITRDVEKRLWFKNDKGENVISAKLDVFWTCGDHAFAIDYKSGFLSPTPSARNFQLRVQALCLQQNYGVKHIRMATVHSRIRTAYDACDYTAEDLEYARQELLLADWKCNQEDAPRSAGDWCRYCGARAFCKEAAVWSLVPQTQAASIAETVDQLPLEALAYIESRRKIAEKVFEAVKERLKTFSVEELNAVGLDRTKGFTVYEIGDAQRAGELLMDNKMVTAEQLWAATKLSLSQIEEDAVPRIAALNDCSQKEAKSALRELLQEVIVHKPRAGHLVAFKAVKQIQ